MKDTIIGVDIGGTKIRAVLWDGSKAVVAYEVKTPKTLDAMIKILTKSVKHLISNKSRESRISKIGIGAAGIVDGNTLTRSPNIQYVKKMNFDNIFSKVLQGLSIKKQIRLDNDARCFLRAEINAMPHINKGLIMGITLGTGVGRALARNGKILKIRSFEYSEEWEGEYQKVRDSKDSKTLATFLVKKLAPLISRHKPRALFIGGGVSNKKGFIATFQHSAECWNVDARIIKSRLGQNSAAIGAALLYR